MNPTENPTNFRIQQRLLEICRVNSASLELEPLLTVLIDAASELTSSKWSVILAREDGNEQLSLAAAPFYMKEGLQTAEITHKNSLAGKAIKTVRSAGFPSSKTDELPTASIWDKFEKVTSVQAVPILFQDEVLGVLETFNKANSAGYSGKDVETLETLAAMAANAMQNQRLIEKNEQSLHKMLELDHMKSDFISIASHELRTPLGLIMGHASFIGETATETQKADIEVIARSAARMRDLIEDFGDVDAITSGLKSFKRTRVLFDTLVPEVVAAFQPLAREGKVRLTHEVKGANLAVEGDADKLMMVVRNLVKNGVNFTNPGGVVKVTAEGVPGYIKITVLDNGIGIPAGELKKIFNRFYQVEKHLTRKHGGMGIGLSAAKEIVEAHGGKINVESVENKGSRFTVLIPLNAAQASAAQKVFLE
jgi:signal transduction histidine kinase